ncbi:MAG TPA: hypothetical protein VF808_05665 [Ktedonobacterales bacterium]
MQSPETPQAALERRLIKQLLSALTRAKDDAQRDKRLEALTDLVLHSDVALDPSRLDAWVKAYLIRLNLWVWPRSYSSHYCTSQGLPATRQSQRAEKEIP